ncbi:MAG: DUF4127 family protein, partial [Ruthenibacterium sp.]
YLLGYGGFYDLANVTGVALSNGFARYLALCCDETRSEEQEQAFLRTLTDSLLKDLCYKNRAKVDTIRYVKDTLGGDPDNFSKTQTDTQAVLAQTSRLFAADSAALLRRLSGGSFLTGLAPLEERGIGHISIGALSFPWQRVFELRYSIAFDSFDSPLVYTPAIDPHFIAAYPAHALPAQ